MKQSTQSTETAEALAAKIEVLKAKRTDLQTQLRAAEVVRNSQDGRIAELKRQLEAPAQLAAVKAECEQLRRRSIEVEQKTAEIKAKLEKLKASIRGVDPRSLAPAFSTDSQDWRPSDTPRPASQAARSAAIDQYAAQHGVSEAKAIRELYQTRPELWGHRCKPQAPKSRALVARW